MGVFCSLLKIAMFSRLSFPVTQQPKTKAAPPLDLPQSKVVRPTAKQHATGASPPFCFSHQNFFFLFITRNVAFLSAGKADATRRVPAQALGDDGARHSSAHDRQARDGGGAGASSLFCFRHQNFFSFHQELRGCSFSEEDSR